MKTIVSEESISRIKKKKKNRGGGGLGEWNIDGINRLNSYMMYNVHESKIKEKE